ncbi:MAG: Fic family protein [Firmicutes bacterium]|nr:Fic family protein [[Eubacterium] siraeum]MCM1489081.1 Fic family protein [Bacillota bacterium]
MERALDFLENDRVDFLVRIAVFHYLFGYIHPFYDGNGRMSRFISSSLLSDALNRLIGFRLSYTIKENISKYYKAFKICNDFRRNMGDLTPFTEMFLTVINTAEESLAESLAVKQRELDRYKKLINTLPKADDQKIWELYFLFAQAALFSENGISTREILENSQISQYTFKKKLEEIPPEYLKIKREGKLKFYMLDPEKL